MNQKCQAVCAGEVGPDRVCQFRVLSGKGLVLSLTIAAMCGLNGRIESDRVLQVKRFWEKPSAAQARSCLAAGHLWNTFVIVAKLSTLLEAGRRLLPQLSERLTCATRFLAAGQEVPCEQEYALTEKADFSRAILQVCPSLLAVSPLPAVTWSDLGTPGMVLQTVQMMEELVIASPSDGFRAKRVAEG
jgi:mannose-1-phosphate guanylyltransferase